MKTAIRPLPRALTLLGALLATTLLASGAEAGLTRLARIFSDGAVLQRDQPVRVWGWAEPGAPVVVGSATSRCPPGPAPTAGGRPCCPRSRPADPGRSPSSPGAPLTVSDVLFGDVWLASGQSNMEWTLGSGVVDGEREIAEADYPGDPLLHGAQRRERREPRTDLDAGEWRICSPESAPEMSAVAYFFARHLHREKGVPIGIVDSTWGGTPAEAWTSAEMNLVPARLPGPHDGDPGVGSGLGEGASTRTRPAARRSGS